MTLVYLPPREMRRFHPTIRPVHSVSAYIAFFLSLGDSTSMAFLDKRHVDVLLSMLESLRQEAIFS